MNPDSPNTPRDALEARLTALLLGELSPSEAAEVEQALARDPELARLHARLKQTIGLVRDAVAPSAAETPAPAPLRLSAEKREKLLERFKVVAPQAVTERSLWRRRWFVPARVAAMLVGLLALATVVFHGFYAPKARWAKRETGEKGEAGEKRRWVFVQPKAPATSAKPPDLRDLELAYRAPADSERETLGGRIGFSPTAAQPAGPAQKPAAAPLYLPAQQAGDVGWGVAEFDSSGTIRLNLGDESPPEPQLGVDFSGRSAAWAQQTERDGTVTVVAGGSARRGSRPQTQAGAGRAGYGSFGGGRPGSPAGARGGVGGGVGYAGGEPAWFGSPAGVAAHAKEGEPVLAGGAFRLKNDEPIGLLNAPAIADGEKQVKAAPRPTAPTHGIPLPTLGNGPAPDYAFGKAAEPTDTIGVVRRGRTEEAKSEARAAAGVDASRPDTAAAPNQHGTVFGMALVPAATESLVRSELERAGRDVAKLAEVDEKMAGESRGQEAGRTVRTADATIHSVDVVGHVTNAAVAAGQRVAIELPGTGAKVAGRPPASVERKFHSGDLDESAQVPALQLAEQPAAEMLPRGAMFRNGPADASRPDRESADKGQRSELEKKIAAARDELARLKEDSVPNEADEAPPKPPVSALIPQPEVAARENPVSTFSLNVSDVSFKLAAASLEKGVMPAVSSVRSEEFINAFDYRDPEPPPGVPVAFAWERARYPFAHNRDLLRFSVKTAAIGRQAGKPLNLVLLLDNSGSMERADRVRIIRECLRVLAEQLQAQDKLSVLTFSRTARLWVDGRAGSQAVEALERVSQIPPEGGTNLGDALDAAYATAAKHYLAGGVNRVVVLTDGAANLGNVDPASLKQKVEARRKQGIALDCFGIGWEGYNDDLLEVLSRNGDGRYGFVNSPEEAATEFAGQLAGALQVAASDVKVQVEFNPRRVITWRQIGYAKHQLTKEQFRDDTVDAAEMAAAEAGNALYTVEVNPRGDGPLAIVRVRFRIPGTSDYREHEWPVPFTGSAVPMEQASPAMRLACCAAAFSEWLASSPFAAEVTPDRLLTCLSGVPEVFGADPRPKQLEWMIRQAGSISGR